MTIFNDWVASLQHLDAPETCPVSKKPKPVAKLLRTQPQLALLERAIRERQALLEQVHRILPSEMAAHCTSACLDKGAMHLLCDSPTWASRLRYMVPQLLSELRRQHPGLANIQVRIAQKGTTGPARSPSGQAHPRPRPRGSSHAAQSVEETAQNLAGDPLGQALRRLAKRLRES